MLLKPKGYTYLRIISFSLTCSGSKVISTVRRFQPLPHAEKLNVDKTLMLLEQMFWYNVGMETYTNYALDSDREAGYSLRLSPRQLHLVIAPHRIQRQIMTTLAARMALNGRVRLVDAGNCFDGYGLARQLRLQTTYWQQALVRVSVARAFTCYQVETLLSETVADPAPALVLNLLDTFYDENVKLPERLRLLEASLGELRRLCHMASVAVSASPTNRGQPPELLEMLSAVSEQVWSYEEPQPIAPLRLF